jgi:polyferredoxin
VAEVAKEERHDLPWETKVKEEHKDHKERTMIGHAYALGVSMSVQRQDNDQSCICVRCIDVCAKTGQ